jgi:glycerophosphoryl diester phosphodiesterase
MRHPARLIAPAAAIAGLLGASLTASAAVADDPRGFDIQAHRGGLGLTVESTIASFSRGLQTGVSTLELDVQITEDGQAVVTHDRKVSGAKCRDTAPYVAGDPEFPYVGKYVKDLTLNQVRQLDCGSLTQPAFPGQAADPGARMPKLSEVFDLVKAYHAYTVKLNVETKVEAGAPEQTAPREQFVQVTAAEIRKAHLERQVTIQSFDWGALMRMREVAPELPIVALTNYDFLQTGQPGKSPWLGGIDVDDFGGDPIKAIASFGADAFSPVHGFPQGGKIGDPDYRPYVTKAMVDEAHAAGITVIPWTIDDPATMRKLIDDGVDGIITDYPDRLRDVAGSYGFRLPAGHRAPDVWPLPQTHAHNDYEHLHPLADALARGFSSVEADVWLVDGELRVAHDLPQTQPGRTLDSLYLAPLAARVRANHGRVYLPGRPDFQLLIDVKSDGSSTYAAIDKALRAYPDVFTSYVGGTTHVRAVTAVISGNRDLDQLKAQTVRFAGYDGRLGDLDSGMPASLMPLLSDNWTKVFSWNGEGTFPADQRARLNDIVSKAHAAGYRVRFWATPDAPGAAREALWSELVAAGVDYVNTDDLHGLEIFLRGSQVDQPGA